MPSGAPVCPSLSPTAGATESGTRCEAEPVPHSPSHGSGCTHRRMCARGARARGASLADIFLAPHAAREAAPAQLRHRGLCAGGHRCAHDKHQQLEAREGRAKSEGAHVHAAVVRTDPLGHVLARPPPCLPHAAWPPNPDPHVYFFGDHSRTTRQAAGKLAERLRRVRTLGPCGQGGASAREAAQECVGARL